MTKTLPTILKGFNKTITDLRTFAKAKDAESAARFEKVKKHEDKINQLQSTNFDALAEIEQVEQIAKNLEALLKTA